MDEFLKLAVIMALCPAPSVLVFFLIFRRHLAQRVRERGALRNIRRRAAGESLRRQLEDTEQAINAWLIYLAVCPAAAGLVVVLIKLPGLALPVGVLSGSVSWSAFCAWKLYGLHCHRMQFERAFDARRCVAEELNRLTAEGFEVFHDVPFEGFTIDHVLLGPPGLFAIETKIRSRWPSNSTEEDRVEFDGYRLNWPRPAESYGLERATNQAVALGKWISDSLGEAVEAIPILTLPGVNIEVKETSSVVLVLSPREIGKLCDIKLVGMQEERIRRICQHLTQRCSC